MEEKERRKAGRRFPYFRWHIRSGASLRISYSSCLSVFLLLPAFHNFVLVPIFLSFERKICHRRKNMDDLVGISSVISEQSNMCFREHDIMCEKKKFLKNCNRGKEREGITNLIIDAGVISLRTRYRFFEVFRTGIILTNSRVCYKRLYLKTISKFNRENQKKNDTELKIYRKIYFSVYWKSCKLVNVKSLKLWLS